MDESLHGDSMPLSGTVLCFTSIAPERRGLLASFAAEMGAIHRLDLTSDVTHLVVGAIDTPKYNYVARERSDIKVLLPEWIEAMRKQWLDGDSVDVGDLENKWKVPPLFGLRICLTGFDHAEQRSELQRQIVTNGAQYHGDLTKQVTHLITKEPKGKKFVYAGQWGIKTVAVQWLYDSLERGMALEDKIYHPLVPPELLGKGAVVTHKFSPSRLGKRPPGSHASKMDNTVRKLRRTASTRIESQSTNLWTDLGGKEEPIEDKSRMSASEAVTTLNAPDHGLPQQKAPGTSSSGNNLIVKEEPGQATDTAEPQAQPGAQEQDTNVHSNNGIFRGIKVHIALFDERRTEVLKQFLVANAAKVVSAVDMAKRSDDFGDLKSASCELPWTERITLIIPQQMSDRQEAQTSLLAKAYVSHLDFVNTDWWVEKCIHRKQWLDRETPLCQGFNFPISGFNNLTVCPTSFTGVELLHFSRAIKLVGARYDETLRPETSVLVCGNPSPNPDKLRYAVQHSIPVVRGAWFEASVQKQRLEPFGEYLFDLPISDPNASGSRGANPELQKGWQDSPSTLIGFHASDESRKDRSKPKPERSTRTEPASGTEPNHTDKSRTLSEISTNAARAPGHTVSDASVQQHNKEGCDGEPGKNVSSGYASLPQERSVHRSLQRAESVSHVEAGLEGKLAELIATRREKASSLGSPIDEASRFGRKHRKLGRATSNPSSFGSAANIDPAPGTRLNAQFCDTDTSPRYQAKVTQSTEFRPSQALIYEDPEVLAAREKLKRRAGLDESLDDDDGEFRERIKSVGVLKDPQEPGSVRRRSRKK